MSNPNDKLHHYMVSVSCTYKRIMEVPMDDGTIESVEKQYERKMNIVITSMSKSLTYEDFNSARVGILTRMNQEMGLEHKDIMDIVFIAISHIGIMTAKQFQGSKDEPKTGYPH